MKAENEKDFDERLSIGGRAFNNGVEFNSDNFIVRFVMDESDNYEITSKEQTLARGIKYRLSRIPFLKGLFTLFDTNFLFSIPIVGLVATENLY